MKATIHIWYQANINMRSPVSLWIARLVDGTYNVEVHCRVGWCTPYGFIVFF